MLIGMVKLHLVIIHQCHLGAGLNQILNNIKATQLYVDPQLI